MHSTQEISRKKKLARCFMKWESCISVLKKKNNNNNRIFSLAWNIVYCLLKSPCFEFLGVWKYGPFWAKKLMKLWHLLITEKFLFWTFWEWEIRVFLRQKVSGKIIFTGQWNTLVLNFPWIEITVFLSQKVDGKMIFTDTEKFLFWPFPWWEIRSFLKQKVNGKMIFTGYWKVLFLG